MKLKDNNRFIPKDRKHKLQRLQEGEDNKQPKTTCRECNLACLKTERQDQQQRLSSLPDYQGENGLQDK